MLLTCCGIHGRIDPIQRMHKQSLVYRPLGALRRNTGEHAWEHAATDVVWKDVRNLFLLDRGCPVRRDTKSRGEP